jgi:signal transduction histidine kinase/CheY-like chemotaxis protein
MKQFINEMRDRLFDFYQVTWWKQIIAAISIHLTTYISHFFNFNSDAGASSIWIPAGIAVGLLSIWGYPLWLGICLGILSGEFIIHHRIGNFTDFILSLCITLITTVAAIFTTSLIEYLNGKHYFLSRTKYTINFIIYGFLSRIPMAILCIFFLYLFKKITWQLCPEIAITWLLGDYFAILLFAPLMIAISINSRSFQYLLKQHWLEATIILFFTVVIIYFIDNGYHIEYLLMPFLVWSVFRFKEIGSTFLMIVIAVSIVFITIYDDQNSSENSLLLLQSFFACISMTTLILNAILNENEAAKKDLLVVNTTLAKQNFELQELHQQKDIETQQREQILIEYNHALEKQISLVKAKDAAESETKAQSAFIANMSHELRSPLNAIIGFSQIMLRTKNLPAEQYENAGIIHRSGDYLLTLINNVLDFSKIKAGKITLNPKNIDFYQLLDDLDDMLHLHAHEAGIELIFDRSDNLPRYIYTDGVKLQQVLLNLLGNAIKFTQQGEVVLMIDAIEQENTTDYTLNFSIRDTGVGIAAEELNKLFEAFAQTSSGRESQEGTGLGLVISRQFVQLMGGNITVTSDTGKGTTFTFFIQVQLGNEVERESSIKARVLALAPNQPIYKLLVVDDKAVNRQLVMKLLVPLGFAMQEACNGQEAITIWEEWQPHLIWMDMRMPVMDGYEATKTIKSHVKGSATTVIALTASVLEEEKAIVLSAGCDDFVRKPFKEAMIFEMLAKHLGVQYIYEDTTTPDTVNETEQLLTTQHFQVMPQEWLVQLSAAALEADSEQK